VHGTRPVPTSQTRKGWTTPEKIRLLLVVLIAILLPSCGGGPQGGTTVPSEEAKGAKMAIEVTSPAFEDGAAIPSRYTCDGLDVSPPLS